MALDAQNACFHAEEGEEVRVVPQAAWAKRHFARGGNIERPWWKMKEQRCAGARPQRNSTRA
eukprot:4125426-Pyramimonas_sp.AAC.1